MTVAVFGSLNADLSLTVRRHPQPGETVLGGGGSVSPGGKGANQALAASLVGAPTLMVGQVGSDANAQPVLSLLRDAGVDLSHVREVEGPTGLAVVTVDKEGENSIIVVPGANEAMGVDDFDWVRSALEESDCLVMQGEIPTECIETAARLAHSRGARIIFNLAPVIAVAPWVILHSDPFVANEYEARSGAAILGLDAARLDKASDAEVVRMLLAAGVPSAVVTLGSKGSLIGEHTSGGKIKISLVEPVPTEAVDTVGAGDAFVGVLAAGLSAGASLLDSAHEASAFASATVRFPGAQASYPLALESYRALLD